MKKAKVLLSLIFVVAVLLASTVSICAIGFDAETVYESVFVIYSGYAMGSGFAIGENCIVTNAHVIGNKEDICAIAYDNTEYQAYVFSIDEDLDIAVLFVSDVQFPYLSIADTSTMKTGDDIYAIGAPKGMAYTLTKGSISAKERVIDPYSYIQIDAPINEGNSGGPLLNDSGEVLGMNTLKMTNSEGIGLAIPITVICNYLQSLDIPLSENKTVLGGISFPDVTTSADAEVQVEAESNTESENETCPDNYENAAPSTLTYVAYVVAVLSLIANIILLILLVYQKKKNITLQYNPKERTDFEIDLWE